MGQIWQGENAHLQNHNCACQLSKSVGWKINGQKSVFIKKVSDCNWKNVFREDHI